MRSTATTFAVSLALMPLGAAGADQGVPRTLLDHQLRERQVMLVGIDDQQVAFRDADGMLRSEPAQRIAALTAPVAGFIATPAGDGAPRRDGKRKPDLGILELTDGQRILGVFVPGAPEASPGQTVRWSHPLLGEMAFRLDDIQRITLDAEAAPIQEEHPATGDVLLLRNGDRLEGFVESIGASVHLEISGQVREIPFDRIAAISFANPREGLAGTVLWLRDSSIVASARFAPIPEGQVAFMPSAWRRTEEAGSESAALPMYASEVLAVAFDAERLVPLAVLPLIREEPVEGRRWSQPVLHGPSPALLNSPDLELPGPMVVEWELPAGAAYFSAHAELPRANWNWGDCILIVSLVTGSGEAERQTEVSRTRINADNPRIPLRISLQSAARQMTGPVRLRIRLDPGMYGPIQDQIILRRPLVLLGPQPG